MPAPIERVGRAVASALLWALALPALAGPQEVNQLAAGRELYLTGRRIDGSELNATVQQDVSLPAAAAACVNCHRRSGLGTAESSVRPLPVTGNALFNAATGAAARPAYDIDSLKRAMTRGVAASGRPLSAVMPRYQLRSADANALSAYLRQLGTEPPSGVTADEIELATVVSADSPRDVRDSMLAVLERYVTAKNSQSRRESERAAASLRHPLGERRDRAFRRWRLTVWTLDGPANTWDEQLQRHYAERPPFALLSGTTTHDWRIVHDFCERTRVPCILPITDVPGDAATGFYSLYYTRGSALEGRITARHIAAATFNKARVLLLYSDDERALTARNALHEETQNSPAILERQVPRSQSLTGNDWRKLLTESRPDVLIAWLDAAQLRTLATLTERAAFFPERIYTAESLTSWRDVATIGILRARAWHVYPYQTPVPGRSQFPREQAWLRAQRLDDLDVDVAARALFACHAFGEGLVAIEANFSREYLLEQFEHMLDRTGMTSLFPVTQLGPGQRVLSNGAYVARIGELAAGTLIPGSWQTF